MFRMASIRSMDVVQVYRETPRNDGPSLILAKTVFLRRSAVHHSRLFRRFGSPPFHLAMKIQDDDGPASGIDRPCCSHYQEAPPFLPGEADRPCQRDTVSSITKLQIEESFGFRYDDRGNRFAHGGGAASSKFGRRVSLVSVRCLKQLGHVVGKPLFDSMGEPEL